MRASLFALGLVALTGCGSTGLSSSARSVTYERHAERSPPEVVTTGVPQSEPELATLQPVYPHSYREVADWPLAGDTRNFRGLLTEPPGFQALAIQEETPTYWVRPLGATPVDEWGNRVYDGGRIKIGRNVRHGAITGGGTVRLGTVEIER